MFEASAPVSDTPRREAAQPQEAPREQVEDDTWQDRKPVVPAPSAPVPSAPAPAPQRVYTTPPRSFQAVSQHDETSDETHRPNRRRRAHAPGDEPAPPALELVETQAEPQPIAMDDALPHRTKPRRRRGSQSASEPLQLVETQPSTENSSADPPTP